MAERIQKYAEFWPFYLREHRLLACRRLHYIGTTLALTLLAALVATGNWWFLLAAVVSGYAFAWVGHFFVEHNRPATFRYPVWSLYSDFRMYARALRGRIGGDLARALAEPDDGAA